MIKIYLTLYTILGIIIPCVLTSQDITDTVEFGTVVYDSYIKIDVPIDLINDTVSLYNKPTGKLHQVMNHKSSNGNTYINVGGNFVEGKFSGELYKNGSNELNVIYKKKTPLSLSTKEQTFIYKLSDDKNIEVPLKFNRSSFDNDGFSKRYVFLSKKDSNQPVGQFDLKSDKEKFIIEETDLKEIKSGEYDGQVTLVHGNSELIQPIEIYKKDKFWRVFMAFIISFILSYSFRYFAINEEKALAYTEARRLLKQVKNDKTIDEKVQKELIASIKYHIFEIDGWLKDAAYYKQKLEKLLEKYEGAQPSLSLVYRLTMYEPISNLERLAYGTKFTHIVITFLLCLFIFHMQYCSNDIFGVDWILDYLKLFVGVLATVIASSGLIKDRIGMLQSNVG